MGFFSWNTSDTDKSIANAHSQMDTFTVHMVTRDGRVYTEENYEGYGVFGGKDFYELVAELNDLEGRDSGIEIYFSKERIIPRLVEELPNLPSMSMVEDPTKIKKQWEKWFDQLPEPEDCEYQGFFYEF